MNEDAAASSALLSGSVPAGAAIVLEDVVAYLAKHLVDRCGSVSKAQRLLKEHEPKPGFGTRSVVDDDVRLALDLLCSIASAFRCEPARRAQLLLGSVGVIGSKVLRPFDEANTQSAAAARAHDDQLQRLASKKWLETDSHGKRPHANKSASAIAKLIDPVTWNTTRKKITKPSELTK